MISYIDLKGGEIIMNRTYETVDVINNTTTNALSRLGNYIPQFIGGLVILLIGLIVASLLKAITLRLFKYLNLEKWFNRAKMDRVVQYGNWPNIVAEVVRWAVIIIFLIPAVEAWGLPQVTSVLNQLLMYIPNVFVAVVVAFVGIAVANIVSDIVRVATRNIGSTSANLLATIAQYAIYFFTGLVVLTQLGIAEDLIKILFTGIIAMIAIAGGLAFGLGGQDSARTMLDSLRQSISANKLTPTQKLRR